MDQAVIGHTVVCLYCPDVYTRLACLSVLLNSRDACSA